MIPTVGRIVHYFDMHNGNISATAAIITAVHNDSCVNLNVFLPNGGNVPKFSVVSTEKQLNQVNLEEKAQMVGRWGWPTLQK